MLSELFTSPFVPIFLGFFWIGLQLVKTDWVFALIGVVVALDTYLGLSNRRVLLLNPVQCVVLALGYTYSLSVTEMSGGLAGHWVWAFVAGTWFVAVFLFHTWYVLWRFVERKGRVR